MRTGRPYFACLDQVHIARKNEVALVTYLEPWIYPAVVVIGPTISALTDQELLDLHNETLLIEAGRRLKNEGNLRTRYRRNR